MLLGKRPRKQPPMNMRRTTSISGNMTVDMQVSNMEADHEELVCDPQQHLQDGIEDPNPHAMAIGPDNKSVTHPINNSEAKRYEYDERFVPSPTTTTSRHHNHQNQTSSSPRVLRTAHFLQTCGLCKRRLAPGRDIYMYRGDTAFCSLECREQKMKRGESKEKWKVVSNKEDHHAHASPPTATSKDCTKSETISAA